MSPANHPEPAGANTLFYAGTKRGMAWRQSRSKSVQLNLLATIYISHRTRPKQCVLCFWRIFRFVSHPGQECAKKLTAQETQSRNNECRLTGICGLYTYITGQMRAMESTAEYNLLYILGSEITIDIQHLL